MKRTFFAVRYSRILFFVKILCCFLSKQKSASHKTRWKTIGLFYHMLLTRDCKKCIRLTNVSASKKESAFSRWQNQNNRKKMPVCF